MAKTKNMSQLKNIWLKLLNNYKQDMNKIHILKMIQKTKELFNQRNKTINQYN